LTGLGFFVEQSQQIWPGSKDDALSPHCFPSSTYKQRSWSFLRKTLRFEKTNFFLPSTIPTNSSFPSSSSLLGASSSSLARESSRVERPPLFDSEETGGLDLY